MFEFLGLKIWPQTKEAYGNVVWTSHSKCFGEELQRLMKASGAFGLISPFPEGDGFVFSLRPDRDWDTVWGLIRDNMEALDV
jgi:hypothetical protein